MITQDTVILDYGNRLNMLEKEQRLVLAEAVATKTKSAKLEEEMSTLKENYEEQISELSHKLIEMMTRKANEYNGR